MEEKFSEFSKFREWIYNQSLKHEWGQSKDPLCYLCLHGAVVSSLSLTQERGFGIETHIFYNFTNSADSADYRIHLGKTQISCSNGTNVCK